MYINCSVTSSDSNPVAHHQVMDVRTQENLTELVIPIQSWLTEQSRLDGAGPVALWSIAVDVATMDFSGGFEAGLSAAILASPTFAGGVVVPDQSQDVSAIRARKLADLKGTLVRLEFGGAAWNDIVFPTDRDSLLLLATCAPEAALNTAAFAVPWPLADGSSIDLSGADILSVQAAVAAYIVALYASWKEAVQAVAAAGDDAEAIDAVTWSGPSP